VALQALAKTIQIRKPLSDSDRSELLRQITEADSIVCKQTEELKAHKDAVKDIVDQHQKIISDCCTKARSGYILKNIEVNITYEGSKEIFTDSNGEIVDSSIIVAEQQLDLGDNNDNDE
jgi:hypothetical protein